MSGIVCILHLDQSPIDPQLLRKLTDFQKFRGPDAQETWLRDYIGLGYALLETAASGGQHQPFSLDGNVWIVADARIDGQKELIANLSAGGHEVSTGASDAELILRSYLAWEENCLDRLIGDFAFAIWDAPQRRLFCARDQMSVKPLFYAHSGSLVVVSNTLDCVRQHPVVSGALNEQSVGDFLMFEINQDPSATVFADIHRLPGGHFISWSSSGVRKCRYWTLPVDAPLFYRRKDDYVDQFHELLRSAVSDRLRSGRVAVYMSGGRDSTAITATAHRLLSQGSAPFQLQAFTTVDPALPEERYFAGLVAERLRIPIDYYEWHDGLIDADWEQTPFHTPEPDGALPFLPEYQKHHRRVGSFSRLALEGEGADNALGYEWRAWLAYLFRQKQYRRFAVGFLSDLVYRPRIPFWGRIVSQGRQVLTPEPETPFPAWIRPDFVTRAGLAERWEQFLAPPAYPPHPVRPAGYESFLVPHFQSFPEFYDASRTMAPMEVRHPFLDLRLVRFLLAVPVIPWCRSKYLIRRAMKGILPKEVLQRPKSTVSCGVTVRQLSNKIQSKPSFSTEFELYVDPRRLPISLGNDVGDFNNSIRARILNHWLQNSDPTRTI